MMELCGRTARRCRSGEFRAICGAFRPPAAAAYSEVVDFCRQTLYFVAQAFILSLKSKFCRRKAFFVAKCIFLSLKSAPWRNNKQ